VKDSVKRKIEFQKCVSSGLLAQKGIFMATVNNRVIHTYEQVLIRIEQVMITPKHEYNKCQVDKDQFNNYDEVTTKFPREVMIILIKNKNKKPWLSFK